MEWKKDREQVWLRIGDSSIMMNFEEVGQWMINRGREQVRPGEMASKASPRPNSGEIFDNIQRISQFFSGRITDVFFVISFHSSLYLKHLPQFFIKNS